MRTTKRRVELFSGGLVMGQVYTNSIKYIPGEYAYTNGHKGNECDHFNDSTGAYVKQKGYGWASEWKPSKIIVSIETEDGCFDVWVDRYFRENWGRLTARRVQSILASLPEKVTVNKQIGRRGTVYYTIDDSSLSDWLQRAKAA